MQIKNVKVFTEEKQFQQGEIAIADGVFAKEADGEVIDGEGCYAIPGMVDVHFHGCVGYDFCDGTEEAIAEIAKYEAAQGVTTIVPATMTLPEETLMEISKIAGNYKATEGADLAGINMEGPFISPGKERGTGIHTYCKTGYCDVSQTAGGCKWTVSFGRYCAGSRWGNGIY